MSKKKRKTRREKENLKTHQFINTKTAIIGKENTEISAGEKKSTSTRKTTNIPPYVMKDLTKVILIISVVIGLTLIIWLLVYQTDIFNFVFDKLNIKY